MTKSGAVDEIAVVKAAAWAWYQHGPGCEYARPMREYEFTRTSRPSKPSRFKQEAAREAEDASESQTPASLSPSHTDMSLLDSYEIERISKQFARIIESTRACYRGRYVADGRDYVKGGTSTAGMETTGRKLGGGKGNGFWARHAIGFCTTRGDMVESSVLCRPRPARRRNGSI